ncbi:hypothetical protein EZV62_024506 [Acer yangbiense]|uniref:Uncharacterized protein n=1 Tax=Acer yangbiense TaxID=1000413 RepID=A0A5C7GVH6_9ROSI|nr:hypothetical protein EZV62_024506 [Acer yangbiense]
MRRSLVDKDNVCQQLEARGIDHLVIPTRDYCLAPVFSDICQAIDFMHVQNQNFKSQGLIWSDIIHVYNMVGEAPMLRIVSYYAVHEYYLVRVKKACEYSNISDQVLRAPRSKTSQDLVAFDDGFIVFVTESDLNRYDSSLVSKAVGTEIWAELSVVYWVVVAG